MHIAIDFKDKSRREYHDKRVEITNHEVVIKDQDGDLLELHGLDLVKLITVRP